MHLRATCAGWCDVRKAGVQVSDIEQRLIRAVRNADITHQKTGGGTNHYVRECLLPSLADEGLAIVEAADEAAKAPAPNACLCGRVFRTPQGLGLHMRVCR
jgi:hypothetical protein